MPESQTETYLTDYYPYFERYFELSEPEVISIEEVERRRQELILILFNISEEGTKASTVLKFLEQGYVEDVTEEGEEQKQRTIRNTPLQAEVIYFNRNDYETGEPLVFYRRRVARLLSSEEIRVRLLTEAAEERIIKPIDQLARLMTEAIAPDDGLVPAGYVDDEPIKN